MFTHHIIKKKSNAEELYLYIDYNYEFAVLDNIKKELKENIYDHVVDYLKTHKINFKGHVIYLVLNGLIIGSILVNNIPTNLNFEGHINYDYVGPMSSNLVVEEVPSINNEIIEDVVVEKEVVEQAKPVVQKPQPPKIVQKEVPKPSAPKQETKQPSQPVQKEEPVVQTPVEEKHEIMVTLYRSTGIIETIPLETYIIGVVGAEMPASFHSEALKAQSVAARTYALKMISENRTLTDSVSHQVYKDNSQLKSLWGSEFDMYYNKIKSAVNYTEGKYLTYNNNYIDAVYHSTSNGQTESSSAVYGNYYPYLVSVDSHWDLNASSYLRETTKEVNIVNTLLGLDINNESEVEVVSRTSGDRIDVIKIDGKEFTGKNIRETLGLRSTDFDIIVNENGVTFTTRGFGHGVGMSQYGANGMAKEGYSYQQILNHYYPGTNIKSI